MILISMQGQQKRLLKLNTFSDSFNCLFSYVQVNLWIVMIIPHLWNLDKKRIFLFFKKEQELKIDKVALIIYNKISNFS